MFGVDLAFPFALGFVAAFNPCGFATVSWSPIATATLYGGTHSYNLSYARAGC